MFSNLKQKAQEKYNKHFKKKKNSEDQDGSYKEMNEEEENKSNQPPNQEIKNEDQNQKKELQRSGPDPKEQQNLEVGNKNKKDFNRTTGDTKLQNDLKVDPGHTEKRPSRLDKFKEGLYKGADIVALKATNAKQAVKEKFSKIDNSIKTSIRNRKKELNQWIAAKADQKVERTMRKAEPQMLESVKDEKMPKCIQEAVEEIAHNFWVDLTNLIRYQLRIQMHKQEVEIKVRPQNKFFKPWYLLRNWYLYSIFPYDMSIWEQIKTFGYIFWKVLLWLPYYGIQAFSFLLLFLSIDKSEEFQLVNFILNYKNTQFLSSILSGLVGYLSYFYCASLAPSQDLKKTGVANNQYCFQIGPGSNNALTLTIGLGSYFFQLLLIWLALLLTHWSKAQTTDVFDQKMKVDKRSRGGRLVYFMIYDLIAFIISFGSSLLLYYHYYYVPGKALKFYEDVGGLVYFAKFIYGLLSFPFLVFLSDIIIQLFTTAKPTGYDKDGNIIPKLEKLKVIYSELPEEDEEDEIDIEEVLQED